MDSAQSTQTHLMGLIEALPAIQAGMFAIAKDGNRRVKA